MACLVYRSTSLPYATHVASPFSSGMGSVQESNEACLRLLCVWMPGTCMVKYSQDDEVFGQSAETAG